MNQLPRGKSVSRGEAAAIDYRFCLQACFQCCDQSFSRAFAYTLVVVRLESLISEIRLCKLQVRLARVSALTPLHVDPARVHLGEFLRFRACCVVCAHDFYKLLDNRTLELLFIVPLGLIHRQQAFVSSINLSFHSASSIASKRSLAASTAASP